MESGGTKVVWKIVYYKNKNSFKHQKTFKLGVTSDIYNVGIKLENAGFKGFIHVV